MIEAATLTFPLAKGRWAVKSALAELDADIEMKNVRGGANNSSPYVAGGRIWVDVAFDEGKKATFAASGWGKV